LKKKKIEMTAKNNLSVLDIKYQAQIKEQNEETAKLYNDLQATIRALENDLKIMTAKCENKDKWKEENNILNKKLTELTNNYETLNKEFEYQRKDRDTKLREFQAIIEKEREASKTKILELEKKTLEFENKKAKMILDFEKEKSKFFTEKDNYESKIRDLSELHERNERKIENLARDAEKYKYSKNNQLQTNYSNILAHTNINNNDNNSLNVSVNYGNSKNAALMSKTGTFQSNPNYKNANFSRTNPIMSPSQLNDKRKSPGFNISIDDNDHVTDDKKTPPKMNKSYTLKEYDDQTNMK